MLNKTHLLLKAYGSLDGFTASEDANCLDSHDVCFLPALKVKLRSRRGGVLAESLGAEREGRVQESRFKVVVSMRNTRWRHIARTFQPREPPATKFILGLG